MDCKTKRAITNELIPPFSYKRQKLRKEWGKTQSISWDDFLLEAALTPPTKIPYTTYMVVTASAENIKKYMEMGYKLKYAHRDRGAITGYFIHEPGFKTRLPDSIRTRREAEAFLKELHRNNEDYHPEDNAHEIIWQRCTPPTKEQADKLNKLMGQVKSIDGFDPCGFIISLY